MTLSRRSMMLVVTLLCMILCVFAALVTAAPSEPLVQWTEVAALPAQRASLGVVSHGDWLYAVGGRDAAGKATTNVWRSQVAGDGSVSWSATQALPVPLYLHAVAASGDYIYVIGGWDDTSYRREVWRAQIQSDGSLASWQRDADYPYQITLHSAVAQGGRLYVVGGVALVNKQPVALNNVYFANIGVDGALGSWQETMGLPRNLYRSAVTEAGNMLYVSGGYDGSVVRPELLAATVNANGTLGTWQASTMPVPREYHGAVIHDGRLVLLGGRDTSSSPGLTRVDSAIIKADGSLGTWATEPSLPDPLYRLGAVTVRRYDSDYIYVLGGLSGSQYRANVYRSDFPVPPTPTPTATLTATASPTPTATPKARIEVKLGQTPLAQPNSQQELEYEIDYQISTPYAAYAVVITDRIPSGVAFVRASSGGAPVPESDPPYVSWTLGTQLPGASGVVSYVVDLPPSAPQIIYNEGAWAQWEIDPLVPSKYRSRSNALFWPAPLQMWLPMVLRK
jgi:N-acetylneuraminic acid mutarotase